MASRNPKARVGRKKGTPKTGGRKRGTPNKVTAEAKGACEEIVDNPKYRKTLRNRAFSGKLHPTIESLLWYYAKGKPKESLALEGGLSITTQKEVDELYARLSTETLQELRALEARKLTLLQLGAKTP